MMEEDEKSSVQQKSEMISRYAHDYRDMPMNEFQLATMLKNFAEDLSLIENN